MRGRQELFTWNGETRPLKEWAEITGIKKQTLYLRMYQLGWTLDEAFGTPLKQYEFHGKVRTTEWNIWMSMKQRCTDPNHKAYHNYGGRGITVCQKWLDSFTAFFEHMGPRPSHKHTLERRDNDKGYEPGNVVWDTRKAQARNTRTNVNLTYQGRTMVLKDWARKFELPNTTLWNRLFTMNWDIEKALMTPRRKARD